MLLEDRFSQISQLLKENLSLTSQGDMDAVKGVFFEHSWINKTMKLSRKGLTLFDAKRDYTQLNDPEWISTIELLKKLTRFEQLAPKDLELEVVGKKKKQHELNRLYHLLEHDIGRKVVDFGGGVGNLAYFLETQRNMSVNVIEANKELIRSGKIKFQKLKSNITFTHTTINKGNPHPLFPGVSLGIGLHTCGNFANDMLRTCIKNDFEKIINFGCCYSKIEDSDYNISNSSDKSIKLNQRALSNATLGFSKVATEFYDYRILIMNYKFTLYHWLYKKYENDKFFSMGNSRRTLYKQSLWDFFQTTLEKYLPHILPPNKEEVESFYQSAENQKLLSYLSAYYAVSRYFGELTEAYLLCDRALFLKEKGYCVSIVEVFDSELSPRNKAIIAKR